MIDIFFERFYMVLVAESFFQTSPWSWNSHDHEIPVIMKLHICALCSIQGVYFAVVAILGHASKTILFFFLPQFLNFALSIPQVCSTQFPWRSFSASRFHPLSPSSRSQVRQIKIVHIRDSRIREGTDKLHPTPNLTLINAVLRVRDHHRCMM